jgi:hypothetical protein
MLRAKSAKKFHSRLRSQCYRVHGLLLAGSDGTGSTAANLGQTAVCSAISSASSTSIPRYLTVLFQLRVAQ